MKGRAWKFGDDVDTDAVIPGRYLIFNTPRESLLSIHLKVCALISQKMFMKMTLWFQEVISAAGPRANMHPPSPLKGQRYPV